MTHKLGERTKRNSNDGMKFNATADAKGKSTSQVRMKLHTVAEEPISKNTASTERDEK